MKQTSKRILGIDPGSNRLGFACLEKRGSVLELISAEVISAAPKRPFYGRLELIAARLRDLILEFSPDEVAVEDIFHAHNARSAFQLGVARGVAIGACLSHKMKIFEYAPTQVKAVVTGYGRADKAQVKKMIELVLRRKLDLGYDATDAIAVAICHASTMNWEAFV